MFNYNRRRKKKLRDGIATLEKKHKKKALILHQRLLYN